MTNYYTESKLQGPTPDQFARVQIRAFLVSIFIGQGKIKVQVSNMHRKKNGKF